MAIRTAGADLLYEFMSTRGLSQVSAAKDLRVKGPTIHEWCAGSKRPRAHHRAAIAVWTRNLVPIESWLLDAERADMAAVRPFVARAI